MENDFYVDAIKSLVPNAKFHGSSGNELAKDNVILEWFDERTEPTVSDIQTEMTRLQVEYDAKQYQRDRQYPPIGDQLDMLYHAIDAGKVNKTSDFYKALKAVKDKHPKG